MGFEETLQQNLFKLNTEKTFIDKILAKEESGKVMALIKKDKLTRGDLLELLYHLSSTEIKLVNFGEWDRYIILKYFVWIREFCKVAENLYDYQDDLLRKVNTCAECKKLITDFKGEKKECICQTSTPSKILTERTRRLIYNNERNIEHACKFNIDLYLNIANSSLSIGATGFLEILKNKFEILYPQGTNLDMQPQPQKVGLFGIKKK